MATGDPAAVRACIDQFSGLIFSIARGMLSNAADAEDAVQDVLVALWKNAGRYDPARGSEATFVATLARRRLIDRWRKESRRPDSDSVQIDELPVASASSDHMHVDVGDDAAQATRAISELRPDQRQVLELAVGQGWSHQSIADRLQIPLGTVKTHVRRGLTRVRQMLQENDNNLPIDRGMQGNA